MIYPAPPIISIRPSQRGIRFDVITIYPIGISQSPKKSPPILQALLIILSKSVIKVSLFSKVTLDEFAMSIAEFIAIALTIITTELTVPHIPRVEADHLSDSRNSL